MIIHFEFKSTFKNKNMHLLTLITRSLLIWLSTCVLASLINWINQTTGLGLPEVILLSLAFSFPAFVFLVPVLYLLDSIGDRKHRILYSFTSILTLCLMVIVIFLQLVKGLGIDKTTIINLLMPYCFAAEVSFFIIARKLILIKN